MYQRQWISVAAGFVLAGAVGAWAFHAAWRGGGSVSPQTTVSAGEAPGEAQGSWIPSGGAAARADVPLGPDAWEKTRALSGVDQAPARAHDLPERDALTSLEIVDLADVVRSGSDLATRLMAVQLLASTEGEEARKALLDLARDPSVPLRARAQAVISFGQGPSDIGRPALLEFIVAEERQLRSAALRALGLLGDPQALRPLENVLWHEENTQVRRLAAEAIAQLGAPGSAEVLLSYLEQGGPPAVVDREIILRSLAALSGSETVPELLQAVGRADDPEVRAALARGLAASAHPQALEVLLELAGEGAGGRARLDAINGLGLIGDPRALPLLEQLEAAGSDEERRFSRTAIGRIQGSGS